MGELLLCNRPIAALPYYIEELSINVYSLEELCYLIKQNVFLMEEGFFDNELFTWIEQELGEQELAETLREAAKTEQDMEVFLRQLFIATGYLESKSVQEILGQVKEFKYKTVFERRKLRGDRYLENKKYVNAIFEYRRMIQMEEECKKNPIAWGNILHNQGIAFARLFFFKEAKECFLQAYQQNLNIESVYAAMAACYFQKEEEEIQSLAVSYGVDSEKIEALKESWASINESQQMQEFYARIDGSSSSLQEILQEYKLEYQKNCG